MRIVTLQKRIMELENAIQSLSTRLVKIREEVVLRLCYDDRRMRKSMRRVVVLM